MRLSSQQFLEGVIIIVQKCSDISNCSISQAQIQQSIAFPDSDPMTFNQSTPFQVRVI